jgi:hypothetical protein
MKYLFLDDERMPGDVTWIDIGGGATWNIVRSFDQAVEWVNQNGFPDVISFDHDLGYEGYDTTESGIVVVTNAKEEKSGYDFAKWLVDLDMDTNAMPENFSFTVHSKNPIGAANIKGYLDSYIVSKI